MPIKLEFKIPRNVKVFNCASTHKEWFNELKKKDASARIITYKEVAISEANQFPKTQDEYNKSFPQRITRQPGQPRVAKVVFEIETCENFQSLKTFNKSMMEFLSRKGVFMMTNISSQLRRDSVGFFTHIHPKAAWREDLQDKIVNVLRQNMSAQEIVTALKTADGKERKERFVTLNFKKQYIHSQEGLIQTETIELQTSPEIKETINTALFKAAKKDQLPGKYYPYGISKAIGIEEYRRVLKRQNAFLESTQLIGIQGLNEEILKTKIDVSQEDEMGTEKSVRDIILSNETVMSIEKTNLTEERGKYVIVCKKEKEQEAKKFLEAACSFISENITEDIRHETHPKIRLSSSNRWQTQIQTFAETLTQVEDGPLPRKPPNAWGNKVVLINDPENFPKLPGKKKPRENENQNQERSSREKNQVNQDALEDRLKEIEERLHKKMEERLSQMERKYQELEEKLAKTLESMNKMTMNFEKYEERSAEKQDQILVMVERQIEEANSRQNVQLRAQLEEVYAAISKKIEEKLDNFKMEITEPKKKSKGVVKPQANKNDSP